MIGIQPNRPDKALIKPSQAMEPEVSFKLASRSRPEAASAEVSPMVSVADTKKINVVEMMALILNSGLNGSKDGNAMTAVFCKELKSTTPMAMATR